MTLNLNKFFVIQEKKNHIYKYISQLQKLCSIAHQTPVVILVLVVYINLF